MKCYVCQSNDAVFEYNCPSCKEDIYYTCRFCWVPQLLRCDCGYVFNNHNNPPVKRQLQVMSMDTSQDQPPTGFQTISNSNTQNVSSSMSFGLQVQSVPSPFGFPQITQPVPQSLLDMRSSSSMQLQTDVNPVMQCYKQKRVEEVTEWRRGAGNLNVDILVCNQKFVKLRHSFAAMRVRELQLRSETGIRTHGNSVSGPNNALCEIRAMVVNANCETIQVAVRFTDQDGNFLLFRSTGGHVLIRNKETKLNVLRTAKIKPNANCFPYGDSEEKYVHTGSFSFYEKKNSNQYVTPEKYLEHHHGAYMNFMGAIGDHDQHFHHSEQAFFKLLYEHPEALLQALIKACSDAGGAFTTPGGLRLCAISADIFTTRGACSNCQKGSYAVRKQGHFFERALELVRLNGTIVVDNDISILCRIDCAVAHTNTPIFPEGTQARNPKACTLHAHPEGVNEFTVTVSNYPCQLINYAVQTNVCTELLSAGGESKELTLVEKLVRQFRMDTYGKIDRGKIPGIVEEHKLILQSNPQLKQLSDEESLLLALQFHVLWEKQNPVNESVGKEFIADRRAMRVRTLLLVALTLRMHPMIFFNALLRNYKIIGYADEGCTPELCTALCNGMTEELQIDFLDQMKDVPLKIAQILYAKQKECLEAVKKSVKQEIKTLLNQGTATAENSALNLAVDFDLQEYYNKKIKK